MVETLDINRTVYCPDQERHVDLEGECMNCGCHRDTDEQRGTVTCDFDENPENTQKSQEDVASEENE